MFVRITVNQNYCNQNFKISMRHLINIFPDFGVFGIIKGEHNIKIELPLRIFLNIKNVLIIFL